MTIFQVTGGGKVYAYAVSPDTMATVDSEGKVKVVAGPGTVTVTAGMSSSMHNNDTAKVKKDFPDLQKASLSLFRFTWLSPAAWSCPSTMLNGLLIRP